MATYAINEDYDLAAYSTTCDGTYWELVTRLPSAGNIVDHDELCRTLTLLTSVFWDRLGLLDDPRIVEELLSERLTGPGHGEDAPGRRYRTAQISHNRPWFAVTLELIGLHASALGSLIDTLPEEARDAVITEVLKEFRAAADLQYRRPALSHRHGQGDVANPMTVTAYGIDGWLGSELLPAYEPTGGPRILTGDALEQVAAMVIATSARLAAVAELVFEGGMEHTTYSEMSDEVDPEGTCPGGLLACRYTAAGGDVYSMARVMSQGQPLRYSLRSEESPTPMVLPSVYPELTPIELLEQLRIVWDNATALLADHAACCSAELERYGSHPTVNVAESPNEASRGSVASTRSTRRGRNVTRLKRTNKFDEKSVTEADVEELVMACFALLAPEERTEAISAQLFTALAGMETRRARQYSAAMGA